jgi:outer membrane protein assembly factor BamB
VVRIDPRTNRITARVPLPAAQAPIAFDIQIVDGRPWVLTTAGAIGLDPATGRPQTFVKVRQPAGDAGPIWSIIADGKLWVLTREGTIDGYDLASGDRVERRPVPVPGAGLVGPTSEGALYGLRDGELVLVREDGKVVWRRRLGSITTAPFVAGGTVWAFASDMEGGHDRLVELDLRSGAVRSSTVLPAFGLAGMTRVGDDLWLTTQNGRVTIVRPTSP